MSKNGAKIIQKKSVHRKMYTFLHSETFNAVILLIFDTLRPLNTIFPLK